MLQRESSCPGSSNAPPLWEKSVARSSWTHAVHPTEPLAPNEPVRLPLRVSAIVSALLALVYCVAKIDMAIKGEVGMPGFPLADPQASRDLDRVWLRQAGNAAIGLGAAILALSTLGPILNHCLRLAIVVALWLGFAFIAAGAGGILLRTLGLADGLGDVPLTWSSAATNAVGIVLTCSWLLMTLTYQRRRRQQPR